MKNILFPLFLLFYAVNTFAQKTLKDEIDAFAAQTGAVPTIDKATGSLGFLRFPATRPFKLSGATPEAKALSFIRQNPRLTAINSDKDNYTVKEVKKNIYGLTHVVMQQFYQGVPVYDGILKFHFNKNMDLAAINGNVLPVTKLNTVPAVSKGDGAETALKIVTGQKLGNFKAPLKVNKINLYVFQKGLAQGYQGGKLLVYEVEVRNDKDVREFLYINAHTKALVEQFNGIHAIDRVLYEGTLAPENKIWEEGDALPGTLDQWQESEVRTSGHIYNLMKNTFGYVSFDNQDAQMVTINNNYEIGCPSSSWNGVTANFCPGTASDDVVAHEWAHAYTEYTSGLIYGWEPGAINEAYSDIWGETVDQINGYMDTGESSAARTGCESSERWEIGEKRTAFDGVLRDMWNPNCKDSPGKITDPLYACVDETDLGLVHINSGVLNHAYALLVDGGTYNGQTITGIGLTKAAHIFWHAQVNYMSSTTDFAAQADILEASLTDLTGINLPKLSTSETPQGLSEEVITSADAEQLARVIAAVEMRTENTCGYEPILKPVAAICSGGLPENAFFYEDFESGIDDWTFSNSGIAQSWTPRNWVQDDTAPGSRQGKVMYGVTPPTGDCETIFQIGLISITSPVITIPTGSSGPFHLAFDQFIATEWGYDGGNVRYRINSGEWKLVPLSAFTVNGYNATLSTTNENSDNPLQGQPGFSGHDPGSVTGSWGQSRINLTSLGLTQGQSIEFRWDLGTDGCDGVEGWYIDDVRVYSCSTPSVQFVNSSTIVNEAEAIIPGQAPGECLKYVERIIKVRINKAPSGPVTVTLNAPAGTASQGNTADYTITPSTFILKEGKLSQDLTLRIYNDAYAEEDETVFLTYTLAGGNAYADNSNQKHTIIIKDNDILPGTLTKVLLTADFNKGFPSESGWTIIDNEPGTGTWEVVEFDEVTLDKSGGRPFLHINSRFGYPDGYDEIAESAPFNSIGMSSINLSFIEFFNMYPYGSQEVGRVDVWDGSNWRNLLTQNEASGTSGSWSAPAIRNISIPVTYANAAMKIRFRYTAISDYSWSIDNVKVTGSFSSGIESAVTAMPDEQYLGPNATAFFYDPDSRNLIAKIKNLTNHDYGCTSVSIDRAGIDETDWISTYHITKKTFMVNPANNNPAGEYEITLYYKASELPGFNGSDVKSMGKSPGGIGPDNEVGTSVAAAVVSTAVGSDYAFTSTFHSGFSGFGLSDSPPTDDTGQPALPVDLISFEGKHTAEGNMLNWTTAAEVNNNYFAVERSMNGRDFVQTGSIDGIGNSAVKNDYKFVDTGYKKGINYYRLKQVDLDGGFAHSRILAIDASNTGDLKFYPNPVQSLLTVELPDAEIKMIDVSIINVAGQQVLTEKNVKNRNGRFNLDMSRLPSGIYQVISSESKSLGQVRSYTMKIVRP
ncbi:M4 family metallopeptidase [Dyadobacter sp. NIV53]|uniref:M4 family metallopeptidase n=1 Tax=Dyadobacter sp. NIV53 TaxID=2861765 RepID=UPI001C884F45|nr:M4 family metallopeptidase [Dyadobacter sp. NIV53]